MTKLNLGGVYVPNVTPFDTKGEIQYEALGELIEYWLRAGVSGIIANASTGESPYLNKEEIAEVLGFVIEQVGGRAQVIAGTGAMATRETIDLTRDAKNAGAEAALITTPYFFRPSEEELYRHYAAVLSAVDLPVILYNVPKFTGYSIAPKTITRIAEDYSGLAGVKDSSGSPGNMAEIIRLCGDRIACLSGAADMFLPTLSLGGRGAVLAIANVVPGTCVELYQAFGRGDVVRAGKRQHTASHVNNVLVASFPQVAAIKAALNHMGYKAGIPRQPLLPLNEMQEKAATEALKNTKLY
jgi:4-hydroxy-tetrahydrodipicolinate synthase